jgi:hypothetical protein
MARGPGQKRVRSLRIKLNAANPEIAAKGVAVVIAKLRQFYELYERPVPTGLIEAISALRPVNVDDGGIKLRFSEEFGDPLRYNLIVDLP